MRHELSRGGIRLYGLCVRHICLKSGNLAVDRSNVRTEGIAVFFELDEVRVHFRKLRIRGSIDYPLAGVAVAVKRSNGNIEDIRIALTAVNPAPVLVKGLNALLNNGRIDESAAEYAGDLAAQTARPLTTSALTPEYRREIIRVFTKRALLAAIES